MKQLPMSPEDARSRLVKAIEGIVHPSRTSRTETLANHLWWTAKQTAKIRSSSVRKRARQELKSMISLAGRLRLHLEDDPAELGRVEKSTLHTLRHELPALIVEAEEEEKRLAAEAADDHGGILERRRTGAALAIWSISFTAAEVYVKATGERPTRSVLSNADNQDGREKSKFVQFLREVFSALGIDTKKAPRAAKDILSDLRDSPFIAPASWPPDMDQSTDR